MSYVTYVALGPLVYQFYFTFQEKERIRLEFTHDELYKFYNQVNKKEAFFFLTVQKINCYPLTKSLKVSLRDVFYRFCYIRTKIYFSFNTQEAMKRTQVNTLFCYMVLCPHEPPHEKTCLWGFRNKPGYTATALDV